MLDELEKKQKEEKEGDSDNENFEESKLEKFG